MPEPQPLDTLDKRDMVLCKSPSVACTRPGVVPDTPVRFEGPEEAPEPFAERAAEPPGLVLAAVHSAARRWMLSQSTPSHAMRRPQSHIPVDSGRCSFAFRRLPSERTRH